jgi:CPA2 family monovalent cation:H+ antiporter-2
MEAAVVHSDLLDIALVALAALTCGLILERLRQPAVVGYILAGVILGPSGFAVVHDRGNIDTLAELGVLMLLFVVGMELSLRAFRQLWRLYVVATLAQIAVSTAAMLLLSRMLGWTPGLALVLGFALALSSTAVAIKILQDMGELHSRAGRVTVGILIAQDLAIVPMMLVIGALSSDGFRIVDILKMVVSVWLLITLIQWLSRRAKVSLPFSQWVGGHADLTPLAALVFCFGAAALSGLLGLSAAYGAFIAGLVIGNSRERQAMAAVTRPIQSILLMVFFLSIGLLIDLPFAWANLGRVLLLLVLVAFFKTGFNAALLRLMGQPWTNAFLAAVLMAQIGEFSFVLALTALDSRLIDGETMRLVVAVAALSLGLSPIWVVTARRLHAVAQDHITSAGQVFQMVYGREAEAAAEHLEVARGWSIRVSVAAMRGAQRVREAGGAAMAKAQRAATKRRRPAKTTRRPKGNGDRGEGGDA